MIKFKMAFAAGRAWVAADWASNPMRFLGEVVAWVLSVSTAVVMAIEPANPPMIWIFPCWLVGAGIMVWAGISRQSFGLVGTYSVLFILDVVGLWRLLAA